MAEGTLQILQERIALVHGWLIVAGSTVQADQFAEVFSPTSPPIGWHLWHIARFADRLQSKLAAVTEGRAQPEEWIRGKLASRWALAPQRLGVLETGMGQAQADAVSLVLQGGQKGIIQYAQTVFDLCVARTEKLTSSELERRYLGFLDYETDPLTGRIWETGPRESLVVQDLIIHAGHGTRHLGMMEALRGLLGAPGTISV